MKKKLDLVKIYLPKKALSLCQSTKPPAQDFFYLYGFQRSFANSPTDLKQDIFINKITSDQKQTNSRNRLLGSLTNSAASHHPLKKDLLIKISITNKEIQVDSDLVRSDKFYIVFYDDRDSNNFSCFPPTSNTKQQTNIKEIVRAQIDRCVLLKSFNFLYLRGLGWDGLL